MAITKTPRLDQTRWSSGQDQVKREDFDNDAANLEANAALFKEGPLSSRPAAGTPGRFYTIKGDSTPAHNGRQYYDNGIEWKAVSYSNDQLAESLSPGSTALTVKAQLSPTADVFRVQDANSNNLLRVTASTYTTNQATLHNSAGVVFGRTVDHDYTAGFYAVNSTKPILKVRSAAGQTANLLEFNASNNSQLAWVDASGGATFMGPVTAPVINATSELNAPNINAGASSFEDVTITTSGPDGIGLTLKSDVSQDANIFEVFSHTNTRIARLRADGTLATNGRVFVGLEGNDSVSPSTVNTAALTVRNSFGSSAPALNIYANPVGQQEANLIQAYDSSSRIRAWVNTTGSMWLDNNLKAGTAVFGITGYQAPTSYFNSVQPRFEVVTGGSTGAYTESIAIRHSDKSASAVNRQVGIQMKLSNEANQTESNKWAGFYAYSGSANAANVGLQVMTNGSEAARFESNNNFRTNGSFFLDSSAGRQWFNSSKSNKILLGASGAFDENASAAAGAIGTQTSNTMFMRAGQIAFYSGGNYNQNGGNAGGGTLMAQMTSERTMVRKLHVYQDTAYDSPSPMLQLGTEQHMQFSPHSINSYETANNSQTAELNLQNNGGRLRLGNLSSTVSLPSRRFYVGNIDDTNNNGVLFSGQFQGSWNAQMDRDPRNNDIWFDTTNMRIGMYTGSEWRWVKLNMSTAETQ